MFYRVTQQYQVRGSLMFSISLVVGLRICSFQRSSKVCLFFLRLDVLSSFFVFLVVRCSRLCLDTAYEHVILFVEVVVL